MKKLIITLIAFIGLMEADTAQAEGERVVTFAQKSTGSIVKTSTLVVVPEGKTFHLIAMMNASSNSNDGSSTYACWLMAEIGVEEYRVIWNRFANGANDNQITPVVITGPATMKFGTGSLGQGVVTYKIVPNLPE
jgi:hypothetical protein